MKKIISYSIIFSFLILGTIFFLWYKGVIWLNTPSLEEYPVRGIDVSHYQGNIDWKPIAADYDFTFIKATEGGDYIDSLFSTNWQEARKEGLRVGAYHFYRNCTAPELQLKNIRSTVPKTSGMLPVTVDVEVDNQCKEPRDKDRLEEDLVILLEGLEKYYGQTPIIYITKDYYELYELSELKKYPIWYRSIFTFPFVSGEREWTFWQYSNRGTVKGIKGRVDLNVFNGKLEDFKNF